MKQFLPKKEEKELISIRMNKELLQTVDRLAKKYQISRNEFIIQSQVFAISHMKDS